MLIDHRREGSVSGACRLWGVDLRAGAGDVDRAASLLSDGEVERSRRFQREVDRNAFIVCRAALRFLLADETGCPPRALRIVDGAGGKPTLEGLGPSFNVSHTTGFGLIGLADGDRIGVDVEIGARFESGEVAPLVLGSAEFARWRSLGPREAAWYLARAWVAKEALLKAVGVGLSVPMPTVRLVRRGFVGERDSGIILPEAQTVLLWQTPELVFATVVLGRSCDHVLHGTLRAVEDSSSPLFVLTAQTFPPGWTGRPIPLGDLSSSTPAQ